MFFSIITVTYNASDKITKTLESIFMQSSNDYEVIIVDGQSSDGTVEIVNNYTDLFPKSFVISEPDHGIYDAMNKGVTKAHGDYIYFLNAGDTFRSKDVLERVKKFITNYLNDDAISRRDFVFHGDILRNNKVRKFPRSFKIWKWIYLERADFCHQAMFSSRDLLEIHKFDIGFRICADRDWLLTVIKEGAIYVYMADIVIADYEGEGVSSGYRKQCEESLHITEKFGGEFAKRFVLLKRWIGEVLGHER